MEISQELKDLAKTIYKEKCICLLAPSFVVDFKYPKMVVELRRIGFNKVTELTYAAKLISKKTHDVIKKNKSKQYICSNCPTIVSIVENQHPEIKKNIINIASPMVLMARFMKQKYPGYKTVFVGPCFSKKQEASKTKDVDYAITFKEMNDIFNYSKKNKFYKKKEKEKKTFDKFYNDVTKIYPLSGAVAETINTRNILDWKEILVADGPLEIPSAFKNFKKDKNIRFLDILFCKGGCVGGPGIMSYETIEQREDRVIHYRDKCKKEKIGKNFGKFKYSNGLKFDRVK